MKNFLMFVLLAILILYSVGLYSQDTCKVLKQEISEKYSGKCKNGLAHGNGLAEGNDKYEGNFKNGLPHGKGKYTWANGEVYEGFWKVGKRDGEGKFWYKKNGADSLKHGVWRGDVFIKKIIPNPYRIIKNINVSRYAVQRLRNGERVLFSFIQSGKPNETISGLLYDSSSGTEYKLGAKEGFDHVAFPYTCKLTYKFRNPLSFVLTEVIFEIEIREPGTWEIILNN